MTDARKQEIRNIVESEHTKSQYESFLRSLTFEELFYVNDVHEELHKQALKKLKECFK